MGNAVTVDVAKWIGARFAKHDRTTFDESKAVQLRRRDRWPNAAYGFDGSRWAVPVSESPVHRKAQPLPMFLKYETQRLSHRAAADFLRRAMSSTLRLDPTFLADLRRHVAEMAATTSNGRAPDGCA